VRAGYRVAYRLGQGQRNAAISAAMLASVKIGLFSRTANILALLHRAALPSLLFYRQILFIENALKF
jgi:hypothetical protein